MILTIPIEQVDVALTDELYSHICNGGAYFIEITEDGKAIVVPADMKVTRETTQ